MNKIKSTENTYPILWGKNNAGGGMNYSAEGGNMNFVQNIYPCIIIIHLMTYLCCWLEYYDREHFF